jgi:hypothetical protein
MTNPVEHMDKQSLGNRRAHRRAALTAPVLIDSARSHCTGHCRDVSEGGLLVELESELPVGMPVDLYFELPTGVAIEARAEVTRSATSAIGLRFEALSPEDRKALAAYCETWRAALLTKAARRVASIPDQRITASALAASPTVPADPSFDSGEQHSGVRIRIANDWSRSQSAPKRS